ncbi:MAG: glycerate kinase [Bacteroidales bacterium]|nr:glycerate kinase [Bacteroidales bacterium]MCL2739201.1 glycerate kinase [Bacteroidales bacterium]
MKVVVAIDAFKGCLSSLEAALAARTGVLQACPQAEVVMIPVADGGEGMLDALMSVAGGKFCSLSAHDPLMKLIDSRYGLSADGATAFVEMAAVNGLPLVPYDQRNPLYTTTFGTGELIRDALERGCRNFVLGIGGSATNDAGLGMLQALGYRFLDRHGVPVGLGGAAMAKVAAIDDSGAHIALKESNFTVICDVKNPFCGPQGAACIFAPQKGAVPEVVGELDRGMALLAEVILRSRHVDIKDIPGAGAAGGLGGAFLAFLNAKLQPGIAWILDFVDFDKKAAQADLVITGEGRADRQTLMGKAPFGVLTAAQRQNIPVALIAGSVRDKEALLAAGFAGVFPIYPHALPLEEAMNPRMARQQITATVSNLIVASQHV